MAADGLGRQLGWGGLTSYTSTTAADRAAMLAAIGVGSVQELFDRQIPEPVRLRRALDLPAGLPEQDVYAHLRELAARNVSAEDEISLPGRRHVRPLRARR